MVLTDEVIFPLTVSLDKLPVSTLKVKVRTNTRWSVWTLVETPGGWLLTESSSFGCVQVMVTVWKREAEKAEVQELGYLSVLQQREPTHTFRHDLNTFKAQGTHGSPSTHL